MKIIDRIRKWREKRKMDRLIDLYIKEPYSGHWSSPMTFRDEKEISKRLLGSIEELVDEPDEEKGG